MLIGSMTVAGLVSLLTILDMAMGIPFGGQMVLDIMFLISAAIIGYMCFDTYKEMS
jgi:hypothetical protein